MWSWPPTEECSRPTRWTSAPDISWPRPPARPKKGPCWTWAAGTDPIAVALGHWAPQAPLWAVDVNTRALELCRANLDRHGRPDATVCLPDEVPDDVRFAAIYSNPPIRIGKAALHEVLARIGWAN